MFTLFDDNSYHDRSNKSIEKKKKKLASYKSSTINNSDKPKVLGMIHAKNLRN